MTEPTSGVQTLNMREVYLETLEQLAKPFPSVKLPDWKSFNLMTGGFRMREFSILCGSTGSGKTTLLAGISTQLLKQSIKHFVLSVETGRHDYMRRILSVLAGRDLNTGDAVSADTLMRVHEQNRQLLESDTIEFSMYEDRIPVEQLMRDIEHMVAKGCKVAMIDNLNFFMEVTSAANSVVEMDRVIHELIIFCKKVDVHIVMVMHPKKNNTGGTRVLSEYDIKGSATAVQEAHNVFLWNRPDEENIKSGERHRFDRELTLAKMRRRGGYVGKTLVFSSNGTSYEEKGLL